MKAECWQDVDRVFQAALEHAPTERAAFLDKACAGDESLRGEVESLIESYGHADDFIEEPLLEAAPGLIADLVVKSPVGGTIGPYRIETLLGSGGMGEVYLAEDTRLGRKVALKMLVEDLAGHWQPRARFLREGRLAAALDHPNICSIYEVAEEAGGSFIAMQYVEGETLASRIRRTPLELAESLDIATQTADALSEAHSRGIIHRDIKPQNIMLTARGQVKVMDFGLAKVIKKGTATDSEAMTESLTLPGTIIGTVPYMSPEQARGENLDARSDIFSFGAVLYEMVSGVQPFAAENAANTMSAILTREPEPLARYSRRIPAELERIVSRSLRKDREQRYQTAKDLIIDLRNLKDELTFEAKLERAASPESINGAGVKTAGVTSVATASQAQIQTDDRTPAKTGWNVEYIAKQRFRTTFSESSRTHRRRASQIAEGS